MIRTAGAAAQRPPSRKRVRGRVRGSEFIRSEAEHRSVSRQANCPCARRGPAPHSLLRDSPLGSIRGPWIACRLTPVLHPLAVSHRPVLATGKATPLQDRSLPSNCVFRLDSGGALAGDTPVRDAQKQPIHSDGRDTKMAPPRAEGTGGRVVKTLPPPPPVELDRVADRLSQRLVIVNISFWAAQKHVGNVATRTVSTRGGGRDVPRREPGADGQGCPLVRRSRRHGANAG